MTLFMTSSNRKYIISKSLPHPDDCSEIFLFTFKRSDLQLSENGDSFIDSF